MYAPEYEQHAAHLRSGMDEHEQREQSYVPKARILAIVFARARIRLRHVVVHALAVRELIASVELFSERLIPTSGVARREVRYPVHATYRIEHLLVAHATVRAR